MDLNSFFADPDPAVFLDADPEADPDPELDFQKFVNNYQVLKKDQKIAQKLKHGAGPYLLHFYY